MIRVSRVPKKVVSRWAWVRPSTLKHSAARRRERSRGEGEEREASVKQIPKPL